MGTQRLATGRYDGPQRWGASAASPSTTQSPHKRWNRRNEPPKRYHRTAKHTVWHYPTPVHPGAVSQIKEALPLHLPDSHNAPQPGAFITYWSFPTAAGIVPQVAEPALPPTAHPTFCTQYHRAWMAPVKDSGLGPPVPPRFVPATAPTARTAPR